MIFNSRSQRYFLTTFWALTFLVICVSRAQAQGAFNVLTRNYNNQRTGANLSETILNQSNVNSTQFGKLFMLPVDDQIFAGILYASDVAIAGSKHNVIFVATVNNSVYAFNADTLGNPLWYRNFNGFGRPSRNTELGQSCRNYADFIGNIGIVGTPVIDGTSRTMYFVTRTVEGDGTVQRLRAVDIATGDERANSPQVIEVSVAGTGDGSVDSVISFNPVTANQRSALVFSKGVVYIAWASFCDTRPYHGWIVSFDATSLAQLGRVSTTPNGTMGGIWMSGAGAALDRDGNLYFATGNGTYDGVTEFGETLMKRAPRSLSLVDFFAPSNFNTLNEFDLDFGSQGPMILPGTSLLVIGGKEGKMYLLDANNLGREVTGDIQIPQAIQATDSTIRPSSSHHMHNANATWKSPQGVNVYVWGENDYLRAYRLNPHTRKLTLPPFATASILPPMGMPGGMLAISAKGSQPRTGIIWATIPRAGDANQALVPGSLYAYNAETLALLWSSTAPGDDSLNFAKGSPPVVVNGKVYVPTISKFVCVYGLKTAPPILQNLAANRPATGSAPCDPSQTPDKAFNGSASQGPDDKWCSAAENPFLQVDLGSNVSINRFVIEHAAAGGDDLLLNTRGFDIQVSSDGTNFDTVENVVGNIQSITTHDIPPITARYVRLNIIAPTQIGLNTANIFDFQVFRVPTSPVTEIREPAKAGSQPIRAGGGPSAPLSVSGLPSVAEKTATAPGTERTQPKPGTGPLIPAPPDVNAPPADAPLTESGVATKVLKPGTGIEHPAGNDCAVLAFTAWKRDGTLFATSKSMGDSAVQCLSTAIVGVAETLKRMVVGEKRRIWVPAELSYVEGHQHTQKRPEDEKPPDLDLTFDLELVSIMKAPVTPTDLTAAPIDAVKTPSGLAYKVLVRGTGTEHPSVKSHAKLHFSGWTSTGKLIETTVTSGHPAVVFVSTTPVAWREILPLMVAGGKVRVWIPSELAFGEKPANRHNPPGSLVYEFELLELQ
ncbi:MAG TPA: FKBP-type peptidyl-prolyl cis-trans isomerase [Candidatus Dormibacteraeota bacterium]|nr:FKBP-type peptidyl-prolyl cis-trans isomerase [Candidatus Dormibacteraeota bacterium]